MPRLYPDISRRYHPPEPGWYQIRGHWNWLEASRPSWLPSRNPCFQGQWNQWPLPASSWDSCKCKIGRQEAGRSQTRWTGLTSSMEDEKKVGRINDWVISREEEEREIRRIKTKDERRKNALFYRRLNSTHRQQRLQLTLKLSIGSIIELFYCTSLLQYWAMFNFFILNLSIPPTRGNKTRLKRKDPISDFVLLFFISISQLAIYICW